MIASPFSAAGALINGAYGAGTVLSEAGKDAKVGDVLWGGFKGVVEPMVWHAGMKVAGWSVGGTKEILNWSDKTKWLNNPITFGARPPVIPNLGKLTEGGPRPYTDVRGRVGVGGQGQPGVFVSPRVKAELPTPGEAGRMVPQQKLDPFDAARRNAINAREAAEHFGSKAGAAEAQAQQAATKARQARQAAINAEEAAARTADPAGARRARELHAEAQAAVDKATIARREADTLKKIAADSEAQAARARQGYLDNDPRRALRRAEEVAREATAKANTARGARNYADMELQTAKTAAERAEALEHIKQAEANLQKVQQAEAEATQRAAELKARVAAKDAADMKTAAEVDAKLREFHGIDPAKNANPVPDTKYVSDKSEMLGDWNRGQKVYAEAKKAAAERAGKAGGHEVHRVTDVTPGQEPIQIAVDPRRVKDGVYTPVAARTGGIQMPGMEAKAGREAVWKASSGAEGRYSSSDHSVVSLPTAEAKFHEAGHALTSGAPGFHPNDVKNLNPSDWAPNYWQNTNLNEGVNEYLTQRYLQETGQLPKNIEIGSTNMAYSPQVKVAQALDRATATFDASGKIVHSPLTQAMHNSNVDALNQAIGEKFGFQGSAAVAKGEEFMAEFSDKVGAGKFRDAHSMLDNLPAK
jgi:hypothetical protein